MTKVGLTFFAFSPASMEHFFDFRTVKSTFLVNPSQAEVVKPEQSLFYSVVTESRLELEPDSSTVVLENPQTRSDSLEAFSSNVICNCVLPVYL